MKSESLNAEIFFTEKDERTVSGLTGDSTLTPGNVGVCLSGGGSRALTCGMGQLRALKHLEVNGQSLLGQVKAISTVSGGSWVGVPFLYLDKNAGDDDYLNGYVADQSRLAPGKTAGRSIAETLDEIPENNIGRGPAEKSISPPGLVFTALILKKLGVSTDMLWQTLVGLHILDDYQLYSPRFFSMSNMSKIAREIMDGRSWVSGLISFEPTSFYSFNQKVLDQDVLQENPQLAKKLAHLYSKTEANRVHRPFLICNLSMLISLPGNQQLLAPVQATPYFTGIVGDPENARDANGRLVGGGGVTAFGFNSELTRVDANAVGISQVRQWSFIDSVGVSSAFFAETINEIIGKLRKGDIEELKEGWATVRDSVFDKLSEKLRRRSSGVSGMLLEKLLDNAFNLVFKGFEKLANATEKAPVLDRELQKLLDEIGDLVPEYRYWPVLDAMPAPSLKTDRFADGGNLENTGIASLLAYRDIDNIISFVNTSTPMTAGSNGVLDAKGKEISGTRIVVDSQVPPLFGYQEYVQGVGYKLYAGSTDPKYPEMQFNQVFESSMFADFLIQMWKNSGNAKNPGSNKRPAICKQNLRVLKNSWFGVKGRGGEGDDNPAKINIVWYYNNASSDWVDLLNPAVKNLLGSPNESGSYKKFNNFPHYSTFSTHLTKQEINLLSNFTAWAVADPSNSGVFTGLFTD